MLVDAGRFGVDIFFTLSAYLITRNLMTEREATGAIDKGRFYTRRALRIFPLYFACLPIAVLVATMSGNAPHWALTLGFLTFTGNFVMAATGATIWSLAPLWSLCVEEQFYLIWPPILARLRSVPQFAAGAMVIALLARFLWQGAGMPADAAWTVTFLRWDSIAAGILLAGAPWAPARPATVFFAGFALLVAASSLLTDALLWPLAYTIAAAGALLIVAAAPHLPPPPRWVAYSGRISFGLYMLHGLILQIGLQALPAGEGFGAYRAVACLATTFVFAAASYRLLETPILRGWNEGRRPHAAIKPKATKAA